MDPTVDEIGERYEELVRLIKMQKSLSQLPVFPRQVQILAVIENKLNELIGEFQPQEPVDMAPDPNLTVPKGWYDGLVKASKAYVKTPNDMFLAHLEDWWEIPLTDVHKGQ